MYNLITVSYASVQLQIWITLYASTHLSFTLILDIHYLICKSCYTVNLLGYNPNLFNLLISSSKFIKSILSDVKNAYSLIWNGIIPLF